MSADTAYVVISVCLIVIAFSCLIVVTGTAMAIWHVVRRVQTLTRSAKPVLDNAADAVRAVSEIVAAIRDCFEGVGASVKETAEGISRRVEQTAGLVQEAVNAPLAIIGSTAVGVVKALEVLRRGVVSKETQSQTADADQKPT